MHEFMDVERPHRSGALAGIRVLDFSRILAGPYSSLLLADLGASVTKVERPGRGDDTRHWGPPFLEHRPEISTYFASLNRDKRSITLDLASEEGRELTERLVAQADVVIENFRPGVAEELGLSRTRLARANPAVVTCSISGFDRSGPNSRYPGTEIVVEAMSGLMHVTGNPEGEPARFGIAMVDIATGLTAAVRIVAALLNARETGEGSHIDCSLYGSAIAALGTLITSYTTSGHEPQRWGSHHPTVVPYGGFQAADGWFVTGVINDERWPAFCEAIELQELQSEARFATNALRVENRVDLERRISRQCSSRSARYWLERLQNAGLLAAPIRTVGEAVSDPATSAMRIFKEIEGQDGVLSPRLDGVAGTGKEPAHVPDLGEHTDEVLAELFARASDRWESDADSG
jgi:crotonobetainyl-CoA:carnitine CoA-transferase CaiB-like acyl-CoA transferase